MERLLSPPDDIDNRPKKRQRTDSPAHSNPHDSTSNSRIMNEDSGRRSTKETEEQLMPAGNAMSIPGLDLIKPDHSETHTSGQVSYESGLLDTLMHHVDSQSNVAGSDMQHSIQASPGIDPSSDESPATIQLLDAQAEKVYSRAHHISDSAPTLAEGVGAIEHESKPTPALATVTHDLGDGVNADAPDKSTAFKEGGKGPDSSPIDTSSLVKEREVEIMDTKERPAGKDDGFDGRGNLEQVEVMQGPEMNLKEAGTNMTAAASFNAIDVVNITTEVVEAARPVGAGSENVVQDHDAPTSDEKSPLPSAREEDNPGSYNTQCISEILTTQSNLPPESPKDQEDVQPFMVGISEHESGQQPRKSSLSALEAPASTTTSLREVPSTDKMKEPEASQCLEAAGSTVKMEDPDVTSLREQLPRVDNTQDLDTAQVDESAEWEIDSSPMDSASDSDTDSDTTSTDDSDEDDADADGDYAMLNPEEQARILMQGDGGSDDEGNMKRGPKGEAARLRTMNEKPEEVVPKPDIKVTEDMKIEELGSVESIVENMVLVKANVSGEYQVLESNSLLCLQDRTVVGVVSETLGRVEQPLYTIRFTNDDAIKEAGLGSKNTPVYYVEQHSTFVFTQPLRAVKGSDASNFYDEEVGAEEMEFSDDEAEAEHKRRLKSKRQGRRDERTERFGTPRDGDTGSMNGFTGRNSSVNRDTAAEINYDDIPPMGEDGYTPLARPSNLHEMIGRGGAPLEGRQSGPSFSHRGQDRGRGRGRGRGDRGNRGGRGGRGRGGWDRSSNSQPRDRRPSFSGGQQSPPIPMSEPSSSPRPSTNGQRQQKSQTPTFALPPIPPPSQHPYPQMPPPLQLPSFSYQNPTPPQAPTISPQPPSYPTFSPSPISPLPQNPFAFNNYATQHNQQQSPIQSYNRYQPPPLPQYPQQSYQDNRNNMQWQGQKQGHGQGQFSGAPQGQPAQQQMPPPPGSYINPAFFDAMRQPREGGGWQGGRR